MRFITLLGFGIILSALSASATDYYLVLSGPNTGLVSGATTIDLSDKFGDRISYEHTGLPLPPELPALVDSRTGYYTSGTNISLAISNLCARALSLSYAASTNYAASVVKVTGGSKSIKDLRKATKKNREADAIDALTARIEMLEALLRQRGIMTPGAAMREDE